MPDAASSEPDAAISLSIHGDELIPETVALDDDDAWRPGYGWPDDGDEGWYIPVPTTYPIESSPSDEPLMPWLGEVSPGHPVEDLESSMVKVSLELKEPDPNSGLVDTPAKMIEMLDKLNLEPATKPTLFLDIEGVNLSRWGSISIIQLHDALSAETYLIDIHILRARAFTTPGTNNKTLKQILEAPDIPKVFFDLRHDSNALYFHFGVALAGVQDLQLMEIACRAGPRGYLKGLAKCIECHAIMEPEERQKWIAVKEQGKRLFRGSYEVFNVRPLAEELRDYCVQDVVVMPGLWEQYNRWITNSPHQHWVSMLAEETAKRIGQSQSERFTGQGRSMALGPDGWDSWKYEREWKNEGDDDDDWY